MNASLSVILRRLYEAAQPGKLLEGMKLPVSVKGGKETSILWHAIAGPYETIEAKSLPTVRVRAVSGLEQQSKIGGALKAGDNGQERKVVALQSVQTYQLALLTPFSAGLIDSDPESTTAGAGSPAHLDWLARVLDAIFTDSQDLPDTCLEQTTALPINVSYGPPEVDSELYYETAINITVTSTVFYPTQRSCPIGVPS